MVEPTKKTDLPCGCIIKEYEEPTPASRDWCVPCSLVAAGQSLQKAAELQAQAGQLLQVCGAGIRKGYEAAKRKEEVDHLSMVGLDCPHGNNPNLCPECSEV